MPWRSTDGTLKCCGEGVDELLLGQVPELDQVGAEPAALVLLERERLVELRLVDLAGADQQLSELVRGVARRGLRAAASGGGAMPNLLLAPARPCEVHAERPRPSGVYGAASP